MVEVEQKNELCDPTCPPADALLSGKTLIGTAMAIGATITCSENVEDIYSWQSLAQNNYGIL